MNNYLLQRLVCRNSIKRCTLTCPWNYKHYASKSVNKPHQETKNDPEWIPIYKFPYILSAARVAKIRKFQYVVTCVAPPITYGFEHYELISEYSTLLALSLSKIKFSFI